MTIILAPELKCSYHGTRLIQNRCADCDAVLNQWRGFDKSESRLGRLQRLGDEYEDRHWREEKP